MIRAKAPEGGVFVDTNSGFHVGEEIVFKNFSFNLDVILGTETLAHHRGTGWAEAMGGMVDGKRLLKPGEQHIASEGTIFIAE